MKEFPGHQGEVRPVDLFIDRTDYRSKLNQYPDKPASRRVYPGGVAPHTARINPAAL
jgi:hypothetical protein